MITRSRIVRGLRLLALNTLPAQYWFPKKLRLSIYRALGVSIDRQNVVMFSGAIIRSEQLVIGRNVFVNHGVFFGDGPITLGESVFVGVGVVLASSDHTVGPAAKRTGPDRLDPIVIERGTWVGARSTVLAGVTIRSGCIIGAGAVVTRDTELNGVYAGVPARRIRDLPDD